MEKRIIKITLITVTIMATATCAYASDLIGQGSTDYSRVSCAQPLDNSNFQLPALDITEQAIANEYRKISDVAGDLYLENRIKENENNNKVVTKDLNKVLPVNINKDNKKEEQPKKVEQDKQDKKDQVPQALIKPTQISQEKKADNISKDSKELRLNLSGIERKSNSSKANNSVQEPEDKPKIRLEGVDKLLEEKEDDSLQQHPVISELKEAGSTINFTGQANGLADKRGIVDLSDKTR